MAEHAAYLIPDDVAVVDREGADVVYVAHLPQGPIVVLSDTAALIWRAATTASHPRLLADLAVTFDQPSDALAGDVNAFLDQLVRQGLLRTGSAADPS